MVLRSAPAASHYADLSFEDILEELSSRFIINLPAEELSSIERICFQVEQAHWFYEDFLRPLNPSLPSLSLRRFSAQLLHTSARSVPLIQRYVAGAAGAAGDAALQLAFEEFMRYKTRVPVCGVVLVNRTWDKCLLVKGWKSSAAWGFPKGKINQNESERDCAVREVLEETGFDCGHLLPSESSDYMDLTMREQRIRLYIVPGVEETTKFETLTRKEISKIAWFKLSDLPTWKKDKQPAAGLGGKFYMVSPFVGRLRGWVSEHRKLPSGTAAAAAAAGSSPLPVHAKAAPASSSPPKQLAASSSQARPKTPTAPKALRAPADAPTGPRADRIKARAADNAALHPQPPAPLFADTSALFPFSSAAAAAPPAPPPVEAPSAAGLRALLGMGSSSSASASEPAPLLNAARAGDEAHRPRGEGLNGVGAQMIDDAGDARSRQLLELLRGPAAPLADAAAHDGARAQAEEQAPLDERERGTAALLAALNIGSGAGERIVATSSATAGPSQTRRRPSHNREPSALLTLLRGDAASAGDALEGRPLGLGNADSPLPAPRAKNTAHAQSLLKLISPAHGSFSVPSSAAAHVDEEHASSFAAQQAQPQQQTYGDKNEDRSRQHEALLAGLLSAQAPARAVEAASDAQARDLLALLSASAPAPPHASYVSPTHAHAHAAHPPSHPAAAAPQSQGQLQGSQLLATLNGAPGPQMHAHHSPTSAQHYQQQPQQMHMPMHSHVHHMQMQQMQSAEAEMLARAAREYRFPPLPQAQLAQQQQQQQQPPPPPPVRVQPASQPSSQGAAPNGQGQGGLLALLNAPRSPAAESQAQQQQAQPPGSSRHAFSGAASHLHLGASVPPPPWATAPFGAAVPHLLPPGYAAPPPQAFFGLPSPQQQHMMQHPPPPPPPHWVQAQLMRAQQGAPAPAQAQAPY